MNGAASVGFDRYFSPCEGGPQYRLERLFGVPKSKGFVLFGIAVSAVTWVPLLVLSAWQGQLWRGVDVPFLQSFATHGRLLIAVPMYFLAEAQFNTRVRQTLATMAATLFRPEDRAPVERALTEAVRWRDSWIVEGVILLLALVLINVGTRSDLPPNLTSWRETADGHESAAGWWYLGISLTLSRFLAWRWLVRLVIWSRLVWRLSRVKVPLIPTHPDLAAGLGGFGVAHVALWPLSFGASALVVTAFAEQIQFAGATVDSVIAPITGFLLLITLVMIAPLLLFMPRLIEEKNRGLLEYGGLAETYVRAFDSKWVHPRTPPDEQLLGSADVQSLADLSNSFA